MPENRFFPAGAAALAVLAAAGWAWAWAGRARQRDLARQLREARALIEASAAMRGAETMSDLAGVIAREAARLVGADAVSLSLLDDDRSRIRIVGAWGLPPGTVGRSDAPLVFPGLARDFRAAVWVPLRTSAGDVIGVLAAGRRPAPAGGSARPLPPDAERLLGAMAEVAGNALQRVRLHEALEDAYLELVLALSNAVDARDCHTGEHSRRLAALAAAVAEALGCDAAEVRHVRWGALLHDLGKLAVPDTILRKRGPLTASEWTVVRRHPEVGAEILAPVRRLHPVLPIIRHHHERWDGSGYPAGLAGEAIPLGARILAAADAFVAMTEDRVYRPALDRAAALAELRRHSGTQFDPRVVRALEALLASSAPAQARTAAGSPT